MEYSFNKMSQEQAEDIASNWHYEGKYSFYNFSADEDDLAELLNPQERGDKYYIVKKGNEEIGFFYFANEGKSVDIGLGMKPELTGRGMGLDFLKAGLSYAISNYNSKEITLSVATFNERAIKVYKKAGFESVKTFMQDTNGSRFEFLRMKYECSKQTASSY
ncbi:GNAT family N-acetyltransferase [Oceanobacillus bengalensis]|uniref:N-acetyltransferase n=1 Tax=Oceanobacillus bengalensis TaxID=1435466 RepID=A0A494Z2Z1_9BACI|nr:GNAT family protein [Oceanobacillus bengalensis]RKQ16861.1 N-acetyltransferase [Oceanobacillus bengalensis]